eukprot:TRINITY_DN5338_c0_g1_i1.p1 TRINITY_DN5338_c0_g1~~TRINITY_DN5338_c0_g1_i1.p1  ORF type:complete len:251 (-),score=43.37 TRINITY_DN5338_c0_g1_i1:82-834(-)
MNGNQQSDLHYLNTGFSYNVADSFMNLFEGLDYVHHDFALAEALQDQESVYWSFQTYSEKLSSSGPASGSQYVNSQSSEGNRQQTSTRDNARRWNNSPQVTSDEEIARALQESEDNVDMTSIVAANIEECNRRQNIETGSLQAPWQDNIDPDNMTYEELVELGEAVGNHNRGLCPEAIASLPVSKYGTLFSFMKKNKREHCIICHMEYRRGERLITLPCKHRYHQTCVSRWLQINKACPVCYVEVFGSSR